MVMVGKELESPKLRLVRCIPWGDGYRYPIADGEAPPELYFAAWQDTCATFPDCPVMVVADHGNACEVLAAQLYTALRPVLMGA